MSKRTEGPELLWSSARSEAKPSGVRAPASTARARRILAALAGFVRGFAGLEPIAPDPAAARRALERRAGRRGSCC